MTDFSLTLSLLAAAILGTFVWRAVGVLVAGRIDEGSPIFNWITCVAYAISAGLMMKLLILPTGVLAETSLGNRALAFLAAVIVFYCLKRRILPALIAGCLVFFALVVFNGSV
ncbi:MAG: AzlD domain-containing protein [Burkholderiaceae bacterium]